MFVAPEAFGHNMFAIEDIYLCWVCFIWASQRSFLYYYQGLVVQAQWLDQLDLSYYVGEEGAGVEG